MRTAPSARHRTRAQAPAAVIYTLLVGVALIVLLALLLSQQVEERRLLADLRANPVFEKYQQLSRFYEAQLWDRSAFRTFDTLSRERPDDAYALLYRAYAEARTAYRRGTSPSPELFDPALRARDGSPELFAQLGHWFLGFGDVTRAAVAAERALTDQPDYPEARYILGRAQKVVGELDEARDLFTHCAAQDDDRSTARLCAMELIPATRQLTVTLLFDRVVIDRRALMLTSTESLDDFVRQGAPGTMLARLAWGSSTVGTGPGDFGYLLRAGGETTMSGSAITSTSRELSYDTLWWDQYTRGQPGTVAIADLPLDAYTRPTTVTVVTRGIGLSRVEPPFDRVEGAAGVWRLDLQPLAGQPLVVTLTGDRLNALLLPFTASSYWRELAYVLLYGLPTLWALAVFGWIRFSTPPTETPPVGWLNHLRNPASPLLWVFDAAVVLASVFTILQPLYLSIVEGRVEATYSTYVGYVIVLGVLLARLALTSLQATPERIDVAIHLGAIIFTCYLVPRLSYNVFGPVFMVIGAISYYTLLTWRHRWLSMRDPVTVARVYSSARADLLAAIDGLQRSSELSAARRELELSLARGLLKAPEYQESLALIASMEQEQRAREELLRAQLGLAAMELPRALIYALGPARTALGNSLIAVLAGLLPFALFLVLAATQGEVILTGDVLEWLRTTVGAPWGPIFLFVFGYTYRTIAGTFGVIKGFCFSLPLIVATIAAALLWDGTPPEAISVWGEIVRLLVTFVFTGFVMDWAVSGFSWPSIRLSYNSPAITTLVAVAGTAVTTVLTGLLTGTLSQILTLAVQGGAQAFGLPSPLPAIGP